MNTVLSEKEVQEIYRENNQETKGILRRIFGDSAFDPRPLGVWCVNDAGKFPWEVKHELIPLYKWDAEKHTRPECVAVITEDTAFLVGLHNTIVAQWGQESGSAKLVTDIESLDSKAATDAIIAASRGITYQDPDREEEYNFAGSPAAEFCRRYETPAIGQGKWDLPTVKQLKIISKYRKEINRCLMAMGFPTLVMGRYWSSIAKEEDEWCAWYVYLNYGYADYDYRSNYGFVRAVSAFQNLCLED